MLFCNNDFAPVGRYVEALFPFEKNTLRRQQIQIQPEAEGIASERADIMQMLGVNKNSAFAVISVTNQIEQFQRGTPVEIASGLQMKIAVAGSRFDLKICAHAFSSCLMKTKYFEPCLHLQTRH